MVALARGAKASEVSVAGTVPERICTSQASEKADPMARHARFKTLHRTLKPSFREY